jgi:hypothetical protein
MTEEKGLPNPDKPERSGHKVESIINYLESYGLEAELG